MAQSVLKRPPRGSLTDVPGIKVGHFTYRERPTGCTAVVAEQGAVTAVDVRGGAPGTRETDLLRPENTVQQAHAIALSGGSAFGLAAADGVMRYLEERGIGYRVGPSVVPIVPAAILFDLGVGDPKIRPGAEAGYQAAKAASGAAVGQGNVGAGAGATVGKMFGRERAMKGGLGSASLKLADDLVIGALAAVNAVGDVVDPDSGTLLAGARGEDGSGFADTMARLREGAGIVPVGQGGAALENTTLGVVAVNASWTKAQAAKVAQAAHDGLARAIRPAHLPMDGDTIFAMGTGGRRVDERLLPVLAALAADVMAQAIVSAVLSAESIPGYPAHSEIAE